MLNQDLADSPLASHRDLPSNHCDGVQDFLRESFAQFSGPLPTTRPQFLAIAADLIEGGIEEAKAAGVVEAAEGDASNGIVRGLQILAEMPDWNIAAPAICYLRLIGHEGRSFDEIGRRFGRCRAAVQYVYRRIQKRHPGLRARADKPEIREQCRRRRTGARKARIDWPAKQIWNPLLLNSPS